MLQRQLVYITGSGHSGSTLLDMILGGHSSIVSLGEAHRLYISANKNASPHFCGCGYHVLDCPFWQQVEKQLANDLGYEPVGLLKSFITTDPASLNTIGDEVLWEPAIPRKYAVDLNKVLLLLGSRRLWKIGSMVSEGVRLHREIAFNSLAVYEAVRKVEAAPIVLDATKNPSRLKALYLSATEPVKVIYLVRDGRAVTRSRMKRHSVSMSAAASVWKAEHRKVRLALASIHRSSIHFCRYEDICREPEVEIRKVCEFLGIEFEREILGFRDNSLHRLGGNPMRFRDAERTISLDEAWRRDLSEEDLEAFGNVAGGLNREFGYS